MVIKAFRMIGFSGMVIFSFACFAGENGVQSAQETAFGIFNSNFNEKGPAVAYNFKDDEYLVISVVNDTVFGNRDIYGQFVRSDGSLKGDRFPICSHPADQACPDVAYGIENQYLVVWCDFRVPNGDIYAARLDASGMKLENAITVADTTFPICDQDSVQLHPRIAHNPMDNNYLVVWMDYRNSYFPGDPCPCEPGQEYAGLPPINTDVYGQRLDMSGLPIPPEEPASTKVNFPVAVDRGIDEYFQDVAYCGGGDRPDEWLVVFCRYNLDYQLPGAEVVHGVRIDGKTGNWIDTWGNLIVPVLSGTTGAQEGPPWKPHFPIGASESQSQHAQSLSQASPRVESNTGWLLHNGQAQALNPYPLPECLVIWTEFPIPSRIRAQRIAYFPDSTAYRRGLKTERGANGMFTLVPLDSMGRPSDPIGDWIIWNNLTLTSDDYQHDYGNISFNPISGDYLAVWDDWSRTEWDGTYPNDGPYNAPPADIAGRRLFLNPQDSSIVFMDRDAAWKAGDSAPFLIAATPTDEGNYSYPGIAYGYSNDQFLVAYEWEQDNDDRAIDVQGVSFHEVPTAIASKQPGPAPVSPILASNFPNPFNPGTSISFRLSSAGRTQVRVFDALGRDVAVLMDENRQAGQTAVYWNGLDAAGHPAASGVYFYEIRSGLDSATRGKMLLLR
ncbi:T9SS type A sorting domain-containing protein [bacterium]|nr:T9SS type A sorting domain-containing protein [bacterium]